LRSEAQTDDGHRQHAVLDELIALRESGDGVAVELGVRASGLIWTEIEIGRETDSP
jgi:hypothetical protein